MKCNRLTPYAIDVPLSFNRMFDCLGRFENCYIRHEQSEFTFFVCAIQTVNEWWLHIFSTFFFLLFLVCYLRNVISLNYIVLMENEHFGVNMRHHRVILDTKKWEMVYSWSVQTHSESGKSAFGSWIECFVSTRRPITNIVKLSYLVVPLSFLGFHSSSGPLEKLLDFSG